VVLFKQPTADKSKEAAKVLLQLQVIEARLYVRDTKATTSIAQQQSTKGSRRASNRRKQASNSLVSQA
jgi:hypothetical protein